MDELMNVLNNRVIVSKDKSTRPLAESTKKDHIFVLNKLKSMYEFNTNLHQVTYENILGLLNNVDLSPSFKNKVISLFIIVKEHYDSTDTDLVKLRGLLKEVSNDKKSKKVEDFSELNTELYYEIATYILSDAVINNPQKFITNYLVFYLHTRNADLICRVVDGGATLDPRINYLVYYPNRVEFIRNNYKTAHSYGSKTNIFTDPIVIDAVSKLPKNEWLLVENPKSIGNAVMRKLYTYNGKHLTEIDYLHNNITHFKDDINALKKIEHNRGSSINELLTFYNKDFKNEKL